MKKQLSIFVFLFLFITSVSASIPSIEVGTAGKDKELRQTCTINGTFCDACNISSVDYPNGSRVIYDVVMTKRQGDFNYTLLGTYTEGTVGGYIVNGYCTYGADVMKNFIYYLPMTYNGLQLTVENSILYIGLIAVLIFFLLFIIYSIPKLPSGNNTNDDNLVISINRLKYLRPVLYAISWGILLTIIFIASNIALAYFPSRMFGELFFTIYKVMFWMNIPMILLWFIWIFVKIFQDKEMKRLIERGIEIKQTP